MARGRSSGSSKGSLIQRLFTGDSWPKTTARSMNSTGRQYPLAPGTIFHREHDSNTIRDTTPPIYLTRMGIRSRSSIKASDGTSELSNADFRQRVDSDSKNLHRTAKWCDRPSCLSSKGDYELMSVRGDRKGIQVTAACVVSLGVAFSAAQAASLKPEA